MFEIIIGVLAGLLGATLSFLAYRAGECVQELTREVDLLHRKMVTTEGELASSKREFRAFAEEGCKSSVSEIARKEVEHLLTFPLKLADGAVTCGKLVDEALYKNGYASLTPSFRSYTDYPEGSILGDQQQAVREVAVKVDLLADALGYEFNYGRATPGGAVINKRPKGRPVL